jgi:membrane protein
VDVPTGPRPRSWPKRLLLWPIAILRRLLGVVPVTIEAYFARRLPQHAAGIAYRVLFSLAPLAIILVSIFGLVLTNDAIREDVIAAVVDRLPVSEQGEQRVTDAITRIASPASALGLLTLLVFAWGATGMMAAIRIGLETAMGVERSRPAVRSKLVDFVLVIGVGVLVLLVVGLNLAVQVVSAAAQRLADWLGVGEGLVGFFSRNSVPVVLSMIVVMLLYRFVPAGRPGFRAAVAGALVTALLLLGISLLSVFLFQKVAQLSVVYGSLAAALVFLYSVYLYASALLVGAAFAAAWALPPGGPGDPVGVQVKRAVIGLFVHSDEPDQRDERGERTLGDEHPETDAGPSPARSTGAASP